jgi:hypothetical protein
MQADRRALNITLNSIGTELTRDDRKKLYSNFGLLYPHGHNELSIAEDFDQIRSAMEKVPAYASIFNKVRAAGADTSGEGIGYATSAPQLGTTGYRMRNANLLYTRSTRLCCWHVNTQALQHVSGALCPYIFVMGSISSLKLEGFEYGYCGKHVVLSEGHHDRTRSQRACTLCSLKAKAS